MEMSLEGSLHYTGHRTAPSLEGSLHYTGHHTAPDDNIKMIVYSWLLT